MDPTSEPCLANQAGEVCVLIPGWWTPLLESHIYCKCNSNSGKSNEERLEEGIFQGTFSIFCCGGLYILWCWRSQRAISHPYTIATFESFLQRTDVPSQRLQTNQIYLHLKNEYVIRIWVLQWSGQNDDDDDVTITMNLTIICVCRITEWDHKRGVRWGIKLQNRPGRQNTAEMLAVFIVCLLTYTEWSKKWYPGFNFAITSVNIQRF